MGSYTPLSRGQFLCELSRMESIFDRSAMTLIHTENCESPGRRSRITRCPGVPSNLMTLISSVDDMVNGWICWVSVETN